MRTALRLMIGMIFSLCMVNWMTPEVCDLDVWNGTYEEELAEAEAHTAELDSMSEVIEDRIHVKDQLIDDLIHHRRTFEDVIDQFLVLNLSQPAIMDVLHEHYPNCGDRELMARNVIDYVSHTSTEAASRLGGEFVTLFPGAAPLTASH